MACPSAELLDKSLPYACTLSNDLLLKAQKELHEKTEWRQRDIDALRQLVGEQVDAAQFSDAFLLRFLRARKFDYERSAQLLLNYLAVRHLHADVFGELLPSALEHVLAEGMFDLLPSVDYHGGRVLLVDLGAWRPEAMPVQALMRALVLVCEYALCFEANQVGGLSVVVDLRSIGLPASLQYAKPAVVRKLTQCFEGAFPLRVKGIHLVHESAALDVLITLLKAWTSEKIRQRLFFHGANVGSLLEHMDVEVLPPSLRPSAFDEVAPTAGRPLRQRLIDSEAYFVALSRCAVAPLPTTPSSPNDGGAWRNFFASYRRLCIDGLNS